MNSGAIHAIVTEPPTFMHPLKFLQKLAPIRFGKSTEICPRLSSLIQALLLSHSPNNGSPESNRLPLCCCLAVVLQALTHRSPFIFCLSFCPPWCLVGAGLTHVSMGYTSTIHSLCAPISDKKIIDPTSMRQL